MASKVKKSLVQKIRIPWIPGFYKPEFKLKLPEIDFSDPGIRQTAFLVVMVFSALMAAGVIFMAVNPPPALITIYERPTVILPDVDRQTLSEGIVVFSLFIMAIGGLYLMRRSIEFFTERESRSLWLGLGFVLVLVSSLSLTYFLMMKLGLVG